METTKEKSIADAMVLTLSHAMDRWNVLDDAALLVEVRKFLPAISDTDRNECFKILVINHVLIMFGSLLPFLR